MSQHGGEFCAVHAAELYVKENKVIKNICCCGVGKFFTGAEKVGFQVIAVPYIETA